MFAKGSRSYGSLLSPMMPHASLDQLGWEHKENLKREGIYKRLAHPRDNGVIIFR
jgi:hypothetical protein